MISNTYTLSCEAKKTSHFVKKAKYMILLRILRENVKL